MRGAVECPSCFAHVPVDEDIHFCPWCGAPVNPRTFPECEIKEPGGTEYCTTCSTEVPRGTRFCTACGEERHRPKHGGPGAGNWPEGPPESAD